MTEGMIFATPAYGNMVTAAYCRSVLLTMEELTRSGINNDFIIPENNDSLVHRARMKIATQFLKTDFSHLFWIDADIEFTPHDVAALWNMETDIAVGCYAMKKPGEEWFAAWKDGVLIKDLDQFDGPIEVDYAGTGFMLIHRKVLEALSEKVPYFEEDIGDGTGLHKVRAFFQTPIHNGILESEDYHFCRIAREAGFKVMMDPSIRLKHWGSYPYGR